MKHLTVLRHSRLITTWHDGLLAPGDDRDTVTRNQMELSNLLLLLVTADYLHDLYQGDHHERRLIDAIEARVERVTIVPVLVKDADLGDSFLARLSPLPSIDGPVTLWGNIDAAFAHVARGVRAVVESLDQADIILVAVSLDFLSSEYCHDVELARSLSRHAAGTAHVIPLIVRPADWSTSSLGRLQPLPSDGKAITTWNNRDEAWLDVAMGIQRVVQERQEAIGTSGENDRLRASLDRVLRERDDLSNQLEKQERESLSLKAEERQLDAEVQQRVASSN